MEKLKQRWGLKSNFQVVIILIVFAITGSTAAYIAKPILGYLGITKEAMHPVFFWILYVLIIFPIYKVILVCIGTLFGQHEFFWNFVKKMLKNMGMGFLFPKEKKEENK